MFKQPKKTILNIVIRINAIYNMQKQVFFVLFSVYLGHPIPFFVAGWRF